MTIYPIRYTPLNIAIGSCLFAISPFLFSVHNYLKINARQGNRQLQLQRELSSPLCVCVCLYVCCAALILRRMTVHDPNKSHCTRQQRRQMASHSLTRAFSHSLTLAFAHSLTSSSSSSLCKNKIAAKSAARTQNEAECNEQHSAHTHSHKHSHTRIRIQL